MRSSFPGLDFLSMWNRRGMASPNNNLAEKQKRRSTPDSGGTAPGKTLTAASKLRPGGFGEES